HASSTRAFSGVGGSTTPKRVRWSSTSIESLLQLGEGVAVAGGGGVGGDAEDVADAAERHPFVVVEEDHLALLRGERGERAVEGVDLLEPHAVERRDD